MPETTTRQVEAAIRDAGEYPDPDCPCCADPIHGEAVCWVCRMLFED